MKTTTLLSVAAATSTVLAQPLVFGHGNHHARHHIARRDVAPARGVVTTWTTEWVIETVTEYYDMTETVTINTATKPGQFFEGSSTPPAAAAPTPTPASQAAPAPAAQAPVPTVQAPAPAAVKQETPAAVVVPQASQPAAVASTPSQAPAAAPVAVVPSSSLTDSSSSSGGLSYGGEVTHYTVGLGACGFDDAGKDETEYIAAISKDLMPGSNGDPICNKKVALSYNGKSITATVRDKCPSCSPSQIDLSEKAFKDLVGDLGIGRQSGVKWTVM